jgi:hypothetical protein
MTSATPTSPRPPEAPEIRPRLRAPFPNLIGMAGFATIVALALAGFFGITTDTAAASAPGMELRVAFPARMRYSTTERLVVRLRNTSDRPIESVTIRFDPAYLSGFAAIQFRPPSERAYEVVLRGIGPGESGLVSAELQADGYWRHRGSITAQTEGGTLGVPVSTLIFP